jgi:hypothetical protein
MLYSEIIAVCSEIHTKHTNVHQDLVLRPNLFPEKVSVNQKGVNPKLYSHKKKEVNGNKQDKGR